MPRRTLEITGDYFPVEDIRNKEILITDGSLILDSGERYQQLENVIVRRTGSFDAPAVIRRTTQGVPNTRFSWRHVAIENDNGDGLAMEGVFLGAIHGLWIRQCTGDGIVARPYTGANANPAGANALSVHGGEIQSCEVGIRATNTKSLSFYGFTVEGCRDHGISLESENENFVFHGGYFENNRKDYTGLESSDIIVKNQNQLASIISSRFSDGGGQHRDAIEITAGNRVYVQRNRFWAYGRNQPVQGAITDGTNEAESPANTLRLF